MPPIVTIPNTIDPDRIDVPARARPPANELLFVGTTQVDANRDGLLWFVDEVLPLIERQVPDATLRIVGGSPPPEIEELGERPNVVVTGYVPDVAAGDGRAPPSSSCRSAPGGGTRLKILESLAYGVPTVSTAIGAEGLDLDRRRAPPARRRPADVRRARRHAARGPRSSVTASGDGPGGRSRRRTRGRRSGGRLEAAIDAVRSHVDDDRSWLVRLLASRDRCCR